MQKKRIALLTGGYSGEAQISYKSVKTVFNHLDTSKYDVYLIDIRKDGWWYQEELGNDTSQVRKADFTIEVNGQTVYFDAVFLCIHGTPGEDGRLQGYFDLLGLPYTSCDAATSALTFNKRYTVAVASFGGVAVAKSMHLFKHTRIEPSTILSNLALPVFVKPNNGGSSIGMSKVHNANKLAEALEKAFKEDDQVLVEEFIQGREFTIGVYKSQGKIHTLPFTEVITENDFFDFEAKYQGKSKEITPAEVTDEWKNKIESAATRVYEVLNCRGMVRIDFIYNEAANQPYMLEVNTVPGQSEASIIPMQVRANGMDLKDFYSLLIDETLANA
ncbi:MAG: D-alanine--D-alanine ligase [Sediminibacterium sp.]|nr:D-alanine--D-alanine ligase [Sediminibacterium sp.]